MSDIQSIADLVLTDAEFRNALVDNPEQTLRDAGVEPTAEMLDALSGVDKESIKQLAEGFEGDKSACC